MWVCVARIVAYDVKLNSHVCLMLLSTLEASNCWYISRSCSGTFPGGADPDEMTLSWSLVDEQGHLINTICLINNNIPNNSTPPLQNFQNLITEPSLKIKTFVIEQ